MNKQFNELAIILIIEHTLMAQKCMIVKECGKILLDVSAKNDLKMHLKKCSVIKCISNLLFSKCH